MTFRQRMLSLLGQKESQARIVTTYNQVGKPVTTPANYEGFASQGFSKNLVVYSAINKIATAAKGIDWVLYSKKKGENGKRTEITAHPLLDLICKPNPLQATASFFEAVVAFKLIAGNSYIELNRGLSGNGPVLELWPVRPDKMKVVGGQNGYPAAYAFSFGGVTRFWPVDPVKLTCNIIQWKSFNPLNDWYGLSALESAMVTLDQNNQGSKWNLSLLQNSATPSGVLQMKMSESNPRGELTAEQYARIKNEFEAGYQGSRNVGKPLLLEGGLSWQQISLSPKEMDFLKSRESTSIDLCIALGVPPEIMGYGQKTFNNYGEARLAFYEETVLPTMDDLRDCLNQMLTPLFGDDLYLDYDKDDIEALAARRTAKMTALQTLTYITPNEKREQVGYDDIEGGDELTTPSTFGGGSSNSNDGSSDPTKPSEDEKPKPKPGKKPKPSDEEPNVEQEDDDEGKGFGWKSLNLLNTNEKRQSYKRQNARRNQLEHGFKAEVKEDYLDLGKRLSSIASELVERRADSKVIEFAMMKECTEWSRTALAKTMARNIKRTLEDFGGMVLGEGKAQGLGVETKANLKFDNYVKAYVAKHTATQISTINATNEKTVRRVLQGYVQDAILDGATNEELSQLIKESFDELSDSSARRIARTEVAMASTQGSLNAVKSLGAPNMFKEWISADDDRVRQGEHGGADHQAISGTEVELDEKFTVPPDADMDGPGDPSAGADQVINCRCVLTYRSKN